MKGYEQWLLDQYMGGNSHFIIPVYQRNYDWKLEHCKQLFDDLLSVSKGKLDSHFFGSIVSASDPGGILTNYLIIDGQQRLTTVSLLMLAMYRLLGEGEVKSADPNLSSKLKEVYLTDKFATGDDWTKLKPIEGDLQTYQDLFDPAIVPDAASHLTINYNFFRDRILAEEITVDQLFDAMRKLQIINITLTQGDDPQKIFESLNSTGLALTEGDKIRNFVLMDLSIKKQGVYYNKYWKQIRENTQEDVSAFVRDYLSMKQRAIPALKSVYPTFKAYANGVLQDDTKTIEDVLKDMLAYSKLYNRLIAPDVTTKAATELDWSIYRLKRLKVNVARPFFLEVLRLGQTGELSEAELIDIFHVVESYVFRRAVCGVPTNSLNKVFLLLHGDIMNLDGTSDQYVDKMVYLLTRKGQSSRFPSDAEFGIALGEREVFRMPSDTKKYLFERLENGGLKAGAIGVWNKLDNGDLTIEHIMPQTLTREWQRDLKADDYEQVHVQWLHRLANLTLTAYNSQYSNKRFEEKRTMVGGFKDGGLHINSWIKDQTEWTEWQLEERNKALQQEALHLWPKPITAFLPQKPHTDHVSLSDDETLTSRNILSYTFHGTEHAVRTWTEMYTDVLKELHEIDSSVLTKLAHDSDQKAFAWHFATEDPSVESKSTHHKIADQIYVRVQTSTQMKISVLEKLFPLFGEEADALTFNLKPVSDLEGTEEPASDVQGAEQAFIGAVTA